MEIIHFSQGCIFNSKIIVNSTVTVHKHVTVITTLFKCSLGKTIKNIIKIKKVLGRRKGFGIKQNRTTVLKLKLYAFSTVELKKKFSRKYGIVLECVVFTSMYEYERVSRALSHNIKN